MANYEESIVKQTKTQLNKLKLQQKNKTKTALGKTKKNFQDEDLPQESFPTTRQKPK